MIDQLAESRSHAHLSGIAVAFVTYESPQTIVDYAATAEEVGLHSFWLGEAYPWWRTLGHDTRGSIAIAAAIAQKTQRIRVCLGIVSPYLRHPAVIALEAASLDELSGGRLIVGLGAARVGINYTEVDTAKASPVAVHRDAVHIIRNLLQGDEFEYTGPAFSMKAPAVPPAEITRRTRVPLVFGATGQHMLRLAGELTDGLILPGLASPDFVRHALNQASIGSQRSGRGLTREEFPLGAYVITTVNEDGAKARNDARPVIARYLINKIVNIKDDSILAMSGLSAEVIESLRKVLADDPSADLAPYITDDIIDMLHVAVGTPAECVDKLVGFADAGLDVPLCEVAGPDSTSKLRTIRLLGEKVAPLACVPAPTVWDDDSPRLSPRS